jgi:hypothetical protein
VALSHKLTGASFSRLEAAQGGAITTLLMS